MTADPPGVNTEVPSLQRLLSPGALRTEPASPTPRLEEAALGVQAPDPGALTGFPQFATGIRQ